MEPTATIIWAATSIMPMAILAAVGYVLWVLFLAVMALRHAWPGLPAFTRALAVPAVAVAILLDIAFNIAASMVFMDFPREATFSQRMSRYKRDDAGWRCRAARWVCANLLDPFDIGGHCRG